MTRTTKGLTIVAGSLFAIAAFTIAYDHVPFPHMTSAESWGLILNGAGVAIAAGGLWVVWYQLWRHRVERRLDSERQRTELEADHDRRQKQATIEYTSQVRESWRITRRSLQKKLGKGSLNYKKLEQIAADDELEGEVLTLLSALEELAVGVNTEVFDKDVVNNMCGSFLIAIWDDFEAYIRHCQKETPSCYTEFEAVVTALKARRKLPPGPKVRRISDGWPQE